MVYIQSNSERTLPHHFDAACALYGAIDSAQDFRLTSFEEVQSGKFDNLIKSNLFVGSVEFMREVFTRVNKIPEPILNSDRPFQKLDLLTVRNRINMDFKYFVKPFQQKLFSGLVVDRYSITSLREFPDDLEVMVYDILPPIISEWRLYVMYGKIEDARNYGGDFKRSPEYLDVEEKLAKNKSSLPRCFTMDVGVCVNQDEIALAYGINKHINVIIEFNDMYAIGNYGVENSLYLRMLRERYFEIVHARTNVEM